MPPPLQLERPRPRPKARALVSKLRQRIIRRTLLQVSFTLHARAHVRLLAKRGRRVVAKTPRQTMGKGRHRVRLRLDPDRWPTDLDFKARPAGGRGLR